MILDKLENSQRYENLAGHLKKGFDYLRNQNIQHLKAGKYEIDGTNVFALISEYETKNHDDCQPEAHRVYADIQYLISGKETIGFALLNNQPETVAYDAGKDIAFYAAETSPLILEPGMFAVFFPHDLHRPGMMTGERPDKVKKAVIKVKL
jgi:YhcH/YjgK/YiaL family protein